MEQAVEIDNQAFPRLCIYLVDQDSNRRNYMENILHFMDGTLEFSHHPEELLHNLDDRLEGCSAVLVGPDFALATRRELVERLAAQLSSQVSNIVKRHREIE